MQALEWHEVAFMQRIFYRYPHQDLCMLSLYRDSVVSATDAFSNAELKMLFRATAMALKAGQADKLE